ncbi:MAG: radical SAM protein [Chlamydiota bacterium]
MFQYIYVEEAILNHQTAQKIIQKHSDTKVITCHHFGELFNRKSQSFRLQKQKPSLLLAKKCGNLVLPTPEGYGIGGTNNYYFSHMLNCIFDCRYCFLQGMYRSGNYVVFVNHEDFEEAIDDTLNKHSGKEVYFFSGYDCDSLALEPVTHFVEKILPFFEQRPNAYLELRTKSINIRFLIDRKPIENCVVAFTLSPKEVVEGLEHRTPRLDRRLKAIDQLQKKGWKIGLRFDPLIYMDNYQDVYSEFFNSVADIVKKESLHSITMGTFRVPKDLYKNMVKQYPKEKLFAHSLQERKGLVMYEEAVEKEMLHFCEELVRQHFQTSKFFPCEVS